MLEDKNKYQMSQDLLIVEKLLQNTTDGIMVTDREGLITKVNPVFCTITGYSQEEIVGQNKSLLFPRHQNLELSKKARTFLEKIGKWEGESSIESKNGKHHDCRLSIFKIDRKATAGPILYIIKSRHGHLNGDLEIQTRLDPLTGLANRMFFKEQLALQLENTIQKKQNLTVIFLDLDRFSEINDTLGDQVGDELLIKIGRRLEQCMWVEDTVARLGDDEFAILAPNIAKPEYVEGIALKIVKSFQDPFIVQKHELFISLSIGISVFPSDGNSPEKLMKNADIALYRAKGEGKNCYRLYTSTMNAQAFERLVLENNLRKAIERNEFRLHYQPLVDLNSGEIVGMEALVRWQHPDLGIISPNEFIPLAEETGLIIPLGEWVLKTACTQCVAWRSQGYKSISVSVNLSARQFQQRNLTGKISKILEETKIDSSHLELELTESAIMDNVESAIKTMQSLHDLGIHFSIDDFGTGYSSLSYLKKFPIKTLKIDRSFVSDITTNPDDKAIANAIIAMAHTLNLKVVAEGVETEEQLKLLSSLGCDEMQGYFFSRPLNPEAFTRLLSENRRLHLDEDDR